MPDTFADIKYVGDFFAGGGGVAATNMFLVLLLAFLLLAGGALFNEALEENSDRIRFMPRRIPEALGPVSRRWHGAWGAVGSGWAAIIPGTTWMDRAVSPLALLALTGLIYTFLEPGVGLNQDSLVLFLSLVVSKGVLTVMYEGGKAQLYRRYLNVDAAMRLFPACIAIALVSVLISRFGDLRPGFVVGFVAATVFFERPATDVARRGQAYAMIAAALLGVSVLAWLLALPLHELREQYPGFWTSLPESIALAVFVVCLDGLMFSLIPLKFMDGSRIWTWSRLAWFALFLPTAFLFAQVLFNDSDAYLDLFTRSRSVATVAVLGGYMLLTFGTWAYFRWRVERAQQPPEPSAAA